jgi:hypothetical protein
MSNKQIKEYDENLALDDADLLLLQDNGTGDYNRVQMSTVQKKILASGSIPWQTWTVSYSSGTVTVGNGTLSAKYYQIGKIVHFEYMLYFGSTTTLADGNYAAGTFPALVPPVTPATRYTPIGTTAAIGSATLHDSSAGRFWPGTTIMDNFGLLTEISAIVQPVSGQGTYPASSIGATFATNFSLGMCGEYEAA